MKRLFGILSVLVCVTPMIYAQAGGMVTLQSSDVDIPLNGVAAEGKVIDSGSCGKSVKYELYEDYTLRIYGNGAMDDYLAYNVWDKLQDQPDHAPWAIELYKKIKAVVIENGVTHIGENTFDNCTSLTKVTIPNSVKSIGKGAFHTCTALANITIPNSVISIGNWAFSECSGLTSITIPNSVKSIGYNAFGKCTALTNITIPNSVITIGDWAFECSGLTSITVSNSVTSIGEGAFNLCSGLTSITIPNSVTSIGEGAFAGCSGLTDITIPNSVTSIGYAAFAGCSELTDITIPNRLTNIEEGAFERSGLTSITIPNSVTSIGEYAFEGCAKMKYVKIAKNVTKIGGQAFPQNDDEDLVIEITSEIPANLMNTDAFGFLCTIYVPETALETYRNAKYWKDHADQIMPKNYTTGISSIGYQQSEKKTAIYDLQGHKVTEMQSKGIYIVNGKKIMK